MKLAESEIVRYSRHLNLREIGVKGQEKLKSSKVLVVGAGGLGSPVLQYLVAAGVGTIGIADGDTVSLSNLQRQVLFDMHYLGKNKARAAKEILSKLNPEVQFNIYPTFLTTLNTLEILSEYDVVIDGTDNLPTRYLLNDACVLTEKVMIYGSIYRFDGQVSIFNAPLATGGRSPNYRDLFPLPPPPHLVPNCADGGVLGVLPGIIGSIQAAEALKVLLGMGELLTGQLLLVDALSLSFKKISFSKKESVLIEKLVDYDYFCGLQNNRESMKSVNVQELKSMIDNGEDFQLIDVRENWESEFANIGGELIPQGQIMEQAEKVSKDKKVVVYCRSGKRSANVIALLEQNLKLDNLYNLEGGILAWSSEIDPSIPQY